MAKSTKRTTNDPLTLRRSISTNRGLTQAKSLTSTDIAARAFELYCERGCQDGHDVEDWLQAESDLQKKANARRRVPQHRKDIAEAAPAPEGIEPADATA